MLLGLPMNYLQTFLLFSSCKARCSLPLSLGLIGFSTSQNLLQPQPDLLAICHQNEQTYHRDDHNLRLSWAWNYFSILQHLLQLRLAQLMIYPQSLRTYSFRLYDQNLPLSLILISFLILQHLQQFRRLEILLKTLLPSLLETSYRSHLRSILSIVVLFCVILQLLQSGLPRTFPSLHFLLGKVYSHYRNFDFGRISSFLIELPPQSDQLRIVPKLKH